MRRGVPHFTLLMIAAALFLRTLVPAGWMPSATGGLFAIEPCPAAEPPPAMTHGSGHHHSSSHGSQHDGGDCAFSPLLAGFTSFAVAGLPAGPLPQDEAAPPQSFVVLLKTGPPALPPPSTGPPALA
jgi:hypothetical protein